jgi:hypothetical protein
MGGGNTVGPDPDRDNTSARQNHGLVPDLAWIAVRRHLAWPVARASTVTAADNTRAVASAAKHIHEISHQGRFAGSPNAEVADNDDRYPGMVTG